MRAITSSRGTPRFIGPKATSSKTVSVTPESWVAGFWKPIATCAATSCIARPRQVDAVEAHRPAQLPPIARGARPEATSASVVLPASDGPTIPTTSPSRSSSETSRSDAPRAPA